MFDKWDYQLIRNLEYTELKYPIHVGNIMPLEPNRCFEKLCLPPLSLNPKTHTPPASTQLHMLLAKEVPNSEPQKISYNGRGRSNLRRRYSKRREQRR